MLAAVNPGLMPDVDSERALRRRRRYNLLRNDVWLVCKHCGKRLRPPVKHDLWGTMYPHRHSRLIWCYPDSDELPVRTGEPKR